MKRALYHITLMAMLLGPLELSAQVQDIRFERFTEINGLSHNQIVDIAQDAQGFLWFATFNGLNKYDGYRFTTYRHDPTDPTSLPGNRLESLYLDSHGQLWIGSWNGLSRYDPTTDSFVQYGHTSDDPDQFQREVASVIFEDSQGTFWLGTHRGLFQFDPSTDQYIRYKHDPNNPESISNNEIRAIYEDSRGNLWIGTGSPWESGLNEGGLNRFNRDPNAPASTPSFVHYRHDPTDAFTLSSDWVRDIYEDSNGVLWIGTWGDGLHTFDYEQDRVVRMPNTKHTTLQITGPHSSMDPELLGLASLPDPGYGITFVRESRSGALWIGSLNGGLNRYDRTTRTTSHLEYHYNDPQSLSDNRTWTFFEDRGGTIWIGTWEGLNKYIPPVEAFTHYMHNARASKSLTVNNILSVLEDTSGRLWVGTEAGLNRIDPSTGHITSYRHAPEDKSGLSNDYIRALYQDRSGTVWIGTRGGLNKWHPKTDTFSHFRHDNNNPTSLSNDWVQHIYEDHQGLLWVGTWHDGLNRLDRSTGTFTRYVHTPADSTSLSDNFVWSILEDQREHLWVGTNSGLNKLELDSNEQISFTRYLLDQNDPHSLKDNAILSLYEGDNGLIWMGTQGGLHKFDPQTERFVAYTERDGLPNNTVQSILPDEDGYLWVSTNQGLARFAPETERFITYAVTDGLPGDVFNRGVSFRSADGTLYFGGTRGLTSFHPGLIEGDMQIPPVVFTGFRIMDGLNPVSVPISAQDNLVLSHKDKIISFEFAVLDFAAPEKNRYAYQLAGQSDEWISLDTRHDVTLMNLKPGDYTLTVRGSNNHGIWNEEGTSLSIKVTPPFWAVWWVQSAGVIGLLALLLGGFKIRTQRLKTINQALQREIGERKRIEAAFRESEERLDLAIQGSNDGLWNWPIIEGKKPWWSPRYYELLGYEDGEFEPDITTFEQELLHPDDLPHLQEAARAHLEEQKPFDVYYRLRIKSGTYRWFRARGQAFWNEEGAPTRMAGSIRDITDQVEARVEREQLLQELASQNAELESKNAELERFTYTVSHDLKSPLVTIKGFLGLLEQDALAGEQERLEHDIQQIKSAADKMHRLLGELLELSRIGRIVSPPEQVALTDLAKEALTLVAGHLAERNVKVVIQPDMPLIYGDRQRLIEVFQNLIDNAIKFLGGQNDPVIELGARHDNQFATCFVRDNGMGIDPIYHDKVFGLFDRLDQSIDGTGIGLALVKRIVEIHGGKIWVESQGRGQGSTFWFTLPLRQASNL